MAKTDVLPVLPHYSIGKDPIDGVLRGRVKSGREFARMNAPPQRRWRLQWHGISSDDLQSLENFERRMGHGSYFDYVDLAASSRHFPVRFAGPIRSEWVQNEQHNAWCELIEQVGLDPAAYAQAPLLALDPADFIVTATGRVIVYAGYGYQVVAPGATEVLLDGVSRGSAYYEAPLGLHTLEVRPVGAGVSSFSFVP